MKTFNGYKKKNLTDSNLLLAGSGHKPLNELLTDLSRPASTNKISITVGGNTLQLDLGARAWDSTAYLPLTGGTMTGDITMSDQHSIKLHNDTSWSDYYRTIPFSMSNDNTAIAYTSDNLQYNPSTDRLRVGGYIKTNSSDSYVLLGGGHAAISGLSVSNADTVDGYHASSFATNTTRNIYVGSTYYTVYSPYTTDTNLNSFFYN